VTVPKFTLFWLVTYMTGLVLAFVNPVFGTYTYLFEYYLRPSLHWWGRAHLPFYIRWNFIAAVVAILAYATRRGAFPEVGKMPLTPPKFLLALLLLMVVMSPFAVTPELSWTSANAYMSLIIFYGLIVGTVKSETAFDWFIALSMAGAGWWGWEAYTNPKRDQGRLASVGSGDTLNDNFAAAHLLTVIPFIVIYLILHKDKRLRAIALISAPFVINTFILCNSRGGVVGLLSAAIACLVLVQKNHRLRIVAILGAVVWSFYVLADPEFLARQQTTTQYEDDGSATQRIASWKGGVQLIKDYPLGTGGSGYEELSPIYIPDVVMWNRGEKRAPHNTLVLVTSEWGWPGLFLFLGYYVSTFALLRQIRKRAVSALWYYRALAIELSLVGLFVAGLFSDRLYAEAPYWMGALALALHRIQTKALEVAKAPAPAPAVVSQRLPAWPSASRTHTGALP
jgi:hypothetical protein